MLLRKQLSHNECFQTKMVFKPQKSGYEAGMVLWWNQFSYSTIGITKVDSPQGSGPVSIACRSPTGRAGELKVDALCPTSI